MVTAVTRKNFDKVTFEATEISSITWKTRQFGNHIGRARSFLRQRNSSWGQLRQEDGGFQKDAAAMFFLLYVCVCDL
jgi:hypothetical protein